MPLPKDIILSLTVSRLHASHSRPELRLGYVVGYNGPMDEGECRIGAWTINYVVLRGLESHCRMHVFNRAPLRRL